MLSREAANTNFIVFNPQSTTLEASTLTITLPMNTIGQVSKDKHNIFCSQHKTGKTTFLY
jgi:hypothetical protein